MDALSVLPHSGFGLHTREGTVGPDGQPTLYVICDCGRGYAWGHYADSARLLQWLTDHDAAVPCPHRRDMQLPRTGAAGAPTLYCADCGETRTVGDV